MCGYAALGKGTSATTFGTRSPILELALDEACLTLTQQPLAFPVADAMHGRAAGVAAVRGGRAGRFSHGFVTAGPIAKKLGMFSCCVTTRRRSGGGAGRVPATGALAGGSRVPRWRVGGGAFPPYRGLVCLPLASLAFRLGVLPASLLAGTTFLLTLGRLPAAQRSPAFRILAVALVMPPRLKAPSAAFVEANSPPQPPAPGGHTASVGTLNLSPGR